ncbi:MAG: hypothetical protein WC081_06950 [Candidatus Ratteibacteria bacterium]
MKTNWLQIKPQKNHPASIRYAIAAFEQDVRKTFLTMTPAPASASII